MIFRVSILGIFHFFKTTVHTDRFPETTENLSGGKLPIFSRGVNCHLSRTHRAPGPREVDRDRPRVRPVDSRRAALSAPFTSVGIPSASPSTDIVVRSSPFFFPSSSSPSHTGGCASPQQTLSRSTCSAPLAACAGGAMESIDSSGFSGSGPGALCVHMYVFAGVTASVSRNIP